MGVVKRFVEDGGKGFVEEVIVIDMGWGCDGNEGNGVGVGKIVVRKMMKELKWVDGRDVNVGE